MTWTAISALLALAGVTCLYGSWSGLLAARALPPRPPRTSALPGVHCGGTCCCS